MKLAYANEEELDDEADNIAFGNDEERLNLNAEDSESSDEE